MAIAIGTHLGSYEVLSLLGRGGMGEVYRARDRQLQREVALKLLPEAFASDPDRLARFEREAQILASLNHSNIAQIYGLEGAGASRCIVMELVDGATLQERLRHGPIALEESLAIAVQVAEALEAAHARGVVHRDLKPANVKITSAGKVKVLDFGLSKAMDCELAPDFSQSPTLLSGTVAGVIMGTAAYMSPEQAKGKKADTRSDIWAFGVVLYEMLTGTPAFEGETLVEILGGVMKAEPDWTALPPATPPAVRSVLRRCLQKDRDRRFRDIADVKIQIEDALSEPPRSVMAPTVRGRYYPAWVVAAGLLVAVAALAIPAVVHLRETPPQDAVIRSTILAPENTTLDFTNGVGLPAPSPDGRRIVFGARGGDGKQSLWVRSLDGLTAQPLAGTEGATFPFWSPDSRSIAFFADGKLKKVDAGGGPALTLADAPAGRGGTWSRNGVIIFAPSNQPGLQRVSSAGGASSPVPGQQGSFPWFLPDGEHFLYQWQGQQVLGGDTMDLPIRVGSLEGGESTIVGAGSNAIYAEGHLLFLREGTLMSQPFDADRLVTTGEAVPLAEGVQTVLNSGRVGVFSASETGLLLYRQGANSRQQLTWFDRTGKAVGTVGEPDDDLEGYPELSPDGRRVAVDRAVQGNNDVWLIDFLRGGIARFTFDAAVDRSPIWSLDGTQVVFSSNRKSPGAATFDLYTKPSSGAGAEQLLLESPNQKVPFGWSPDGQILLYRENDPKTGMDVWAMPMQGRKPVAVANSPFGEANGQFSPDGRWVAYQSIESGRYEIHVVPFPAGSGKWQISTSGGIWPRWRRDGKELFFVGPDRQVMAATINASGASFEAAPPVPLFETLMVVSLAAGKPQYAVSADGRFLITVPAEDATSASMTLLQNWRPSR